ncbi:MAG TPA: hypothetical protein VLD19_07305 [Chitinophagaceae bacterium]|nr:hypothetical protein [Chitinophagaceae bacterium]
MRKIGTLIIMSSLFMFSCKSKNGNSSDQGETKTPETTTQDQKPGITSQPKTYKVVFSPDSALLGKKNEALIKITGATAVALQDPDGKDNGIELTVKLTVTNKEKISSSSNLHVDYPNSRLQLDNGTNTVCDTGTDFLRAAPESTSKEESWVYKIPAGTKPTALNLFMDDTRVSVSVSLN